MIKSTPVPSGGSRTIKNLAALFASQVTTSILNIAPLAFVPPYLGVTGMGRLTIALSFTAICGTLIVMGTGMHIVREVARDHQRLSEIVSSAVILRVLIAMLLLPIVFLSLAVLDYPPETQTVVLMMYVAVALNMIGSTFASALQALERMSWSSAAVVAKKLVAVAIGWLVLWQGGGLVGYVCVLILSEVVEFVLNLSYFVKVAPIKLVFQRSAVRQVFLGGMPFLLWLLLQQFYNQSSSLTLSKLGGEAAVGWLGTALQFVFPLFAVPGVAITVLLPQLSQLHVLDPAAFKHAVTRSLNYLALITLPLAFGLCAIADRLIMLFNYPPAFYNSIPVLRVLAFLLPVASLLMVMATAIAAMKKERIWARVSFFSLALVIVLNVVLVPLSQARWGNPAIGAAAANLGTELATIVVALRLFGSAMLEPRSFAMLAKTSLAGFVMASVVIVASAIPLALVILLGGVVYVGLVLVLRAIPPEDLEPVYRLVAERTPWVIPNMLQRVFLGRRGR